MNRLKTLPDNYRKKRACVVPTCANERFDLVHKFPMDNERAEQWRTALDIADICNLPIDVIRKRLFVCSRHFRATDYKNIESRWLNKTALPNINLKVLDNLDVIDRVALQQRINENSVAEAPQITMLPSALTTKIINAHAKITVSDLDSAKAIILLQDRQQVTPRHSNQIASGSRDTLTHGRFRKIKKRKARIQIIKTDCSDTFTEEFIVKRDPRQSQRRIRLEQRKLIETIDTDTDYDIKELNNIDEGINAEQVHAKVIVKSRRDGAANGSCPSKPCVLIKYVTVPTAPLQFAAKYNAVAAAATAATAATMTIDSLELNVDNYPGGIRATYLWLRDHCRCAVCYNHATAQRKMSILDIPADIKPESVDVTDDEVHVKWIDGHESTYKLDFLFNAQNHVYRQPIATEKEILWTADELQTYNYARVSLNDYLCNDLVARSVVQSLVQFGVAFVDGVPPNSQCTEMTIKRLFPTQKTLFGEMFSFNDAPDHNDTAYSREYLGAHTDNTYFSDAAGILVLHCIEHKGTGGESLLLDGFKAIETLQARKPETVERLYTTPVAAEYIEPGKHHTHCAPLLRKNPITDSMEQLRFNVYDRSTFVTVPHEKVNEFYADFRELATEIQSPQYEWWFKLNPGTVMFFNNWRVLHGRSAYTGHRSMTGSYVSRSEFMSTARTMGLVR